MGFLGEGATPGGDETVPPPYLHLWPLKACDRDMNFCGTDVWGQVSFILK